MESSIQLFMSFLGRYPIFFGLLRELFLKVLECEKEETNIG